MNTITKGPDSFDFTTVEELLETPLVRRHNATHFAYNARQLWAYDGHALSLVGRLKEPVRIPAQVSLAQDQ